MGDVEVCPPASGSGPLKAGMPLSHTVLSSGNASPKRSFLEIIFDGRLEWLQSPLPNLKGMKSGAKIVPDVILLSATDRKEPGHLVARKMTEAAGRLGFGKERNVLWSFVRAPSQQALQREIEALGDFGALPSPRKIVARLQMLIGELAGRRVLALRPELFQVAEEEWVSPVTGSPMEDGCGFIGEELLPELLGEQQAKGVMAIQVRAVVPAKGIFKGILVLKRNLGRAIQLTPSMRKVPPSRLPDRQAESWLMIKQVMPSQSNKQRGPNLIKTSDGLLSVPRLQSDKKLSDIVQQLLMHLGVPEDKLGIYLERQSPQDVFLVGVADPTAALPKDHVFVTGLPGVSEVFVTRSPCVLPEDGRVLPAVDARPAKMGTADWEWLRKLPFGAIIFSSKGATPLPSLISDGDLDGDLYFVMWNKKLLGHIHATPVKKSTGQPELRPVTASASPSTATSPSWLTAAQEHMTDPTALRECLDIGPLFKRWEKSANELGLGHEDTRAWADAYKQSLDRGKHGGDIKLPEHLQELWRPTPKKKKALKRKAPDIGQQREGRSRKMRAPANWGWYELRALVEEEGLAVNCNVGGQRSRKLPDVIREVEAALKSKGKELPASWAPLREPQTSGAQGRKPKDEKKSRKEALCLCSVAYKCMASGTTLECNGKRARFLGGHARTKDEQGCNWLVECLCPACEAADLCYLDSCGRVLTVEEFYEHSGGSEISSLKGAWRTAISVHHGGSSTGTMPLDKWVKTESERKLNILKHDYLMVYWPGNCKWYQALILDICDQSQACKVCCPCSCAP